jgi:hypothetical protein
LEGLAMEDVGIIYGHLVHFTVFCYILWTFGIVRRNLVYFSRFGILFEEKSGNPVRKSKAFPLLQLVAPRKYWLQTFEVINSKLKLGIKNL